VLEEFVTPYLSEDKEVLEIGVGGARVAQLVHSKVKNLHVLDISEEMLKKAKANLQTATNVTFHHSADAPAFPEEVKKNKFDFIYAFDVFVHNDTHTLF